MPIRKPRGPKRPGQKPRSWKLHKGDSTKNTPFVIDQNKSILKREIDRVGNKWGMNAQTRREILNTCLHIALRARRVFVHIRQSQQTTYYWRVLLAGHPRSRRAQSTVGTPSPEILTKARHALGVPESISLPRIKRGLENAGSVEEAQFKKLDELFPTAGAPAPILALFHEPRFGHEVWKAAQNSVRNISSI